MFTVQLKLFTKGNNISSVQSRKEAMEEASLLQEAGALGQGLESKIQMMQKLQKQGIRKVQKARAQLTSKLELTESQR